MDHDALVALVDRATARGAPPDVVDRAKEEVSELFLAHQDRIYGLCRQFFGDPVRALVHTVQTVHVAHHRLGEWRGEGPFWPWVYGVARDVALRTLARKRSLLTADGVLIPGSDVAKALAPMRREDWQELLRRVSLDALSADEQEASYLRYVEGLEINEITEVLQVQGTGARGLLQRARHKLGVALRMPEGPEVQRLGEHPRFTDLAVAEPRDPLKAHLSQCPRCRVDRRRLRDPLAVSPRELEGVREALANARQEAGRVLVSSWRTAVSGGPARDDAIRLPVLPHGTVLDSYVLDGLVERTGMAIAYRAHHDLTGQVHLVKVLATRDPNVRARLQREFRQLRALHHEGVTAVTDHLLVDGSPALVMELVDGPSLQMFLRHEVLPPLELVDTLAVDVLSGMAAAHAEGLVHRDLRPANVLLDVSTDQIRGRVTGLGIARLLSVLEGGTAFGTPSYLAPEQLQDATRSDARSDVFALGAVLYELATGQRCFAARDHVDAVKRVFDLEFVPPGALRPDLPERMEQAILSCLKADPDARPKSAAALLDLWTRGGGRAPRPVHTLTEGERASYRFMRRILPLPEGELAHGAATPSGRSARTPAPSPVGALQPRGGNIVAFVGVVSILLAAAAGALWSTLSREASPGPIFWPVARSVPLAIDPALSPDGTFVAFSDQQEIYVLGLDDARPTVLTGAQTDAATDPAWSPDGRRIAFSTQTGLYVVGTDGRGDAVFVADFAFEPTWSPDGERIAFVSAPTPADGADHPRRAGLHIVNTLTRERFTLVHEVDGGPIQPAWAPNGIRIAWSSPAGTVVAAAQGGEPVPLPGSAGTWRPVWLDDQVLAVLCQPEPGAFAVCRYTEDAAGWTGPVRWIPLTKRPRTFDASLASRRLVVGLEARTWSALRVLPGGLVEEVPRDSAFPASATPSPDGQYVAAVDATDPGRLWVRRAPGRWSTILQADRVLAPAWRPDGSAIMFAGSIDGALGVFEIPPQGGVPRRLSDPGLDWLAPAYWSADGTHVAWTDRGVAPPAPVVIDVRDPWAPQIDDARAEPLDGYEAGAFSPSGARLLVRVAPDAWSVVDLDTGGSRGAPISATTATWAAEDSLYVADGSIIRRYDLGAPGPEHGASLDLTPWRVDLHPALALGPKGALWVSAWREDGGLERMDLPVE